MKIMQNIMRVLGESHYIKYIITLLLIILVVGFLDDNSLWNRRGRTQEIAKLQAEIDVLKAKYEEDTYKLNSMDDYDCVERLAREKYLMHRPDEDVYIIRYSAPEE